MPDMTEPMTADQLAEIQAVEDDTRYGPWLLRDALEGDGFPGNLWVVSTDPNSDNEDGAYAVVVSIGDRNVGAFIEMARTAVPELLAEVKRLAGELDRANGSISAIRGWATSRLEVLHHPQHVPHSSVHAAQVAVLDDLIRSLDHLASRPQP